MTPPRLPTRLLQRWLPAESVEAVLGDLTEGYEDIATKEGSRRANAWFWRETLLLLRELGVAHTVVDGPQGFSNSVPALWEVTHPRYALLRLHGRNSATWNVKGQTSASDRFNYDYPDGELRDMVPRIQQLALTAMQTHVIFNNNMEDQGVRNARRLMELLKVTSSDRR